MHLFTKLNLSLFYNDLILIFLSKYIFRENITNNIKNENILILFYLNLNVFEAKSFKHSNYKLSLKAKGFES